MVLKRYKGDDMSVTISPMVFLPWVGDPGHTVEMDKLKLVIGDKNKLPDVISIAPYWLKDDDVNAGYRIEKELIKWLDAYYRERNQEVPLFYLNPYSVNIFSNSKPHNWDTFKDDKTAEQQIDSWRKFIKGLLGVFGGRVYGIAAGFEDSVQGLWSGDFETYEERIIRPVVSEAIKAGVTAIGFNDTMSGDSLNSNSGARAWEERIKRWAESDSGKGCSHFGVHLYSYVGKDWEFDKMYNKTVGYVRKYLGSTAIIDITETGYEARKKKKFLWFNCGLQNCEKTQAEYWKRTLDFVGKQREIGMVVAYNWWMPSTSKDYYGLLTTDGLAERAALKVLKENNWRA